MVQTADQLKAALITAYGEVSSWRYKHLVPDLPFIVDDRTEKDYDASGRLYSWFCEILVTVLDPKSVNLSLQGGVPKSAAVGKWLERQNATKTSFGTAFSITPENLIELDDLIIRLGAITKNTYNVKSYKYVVPRTSRSLRRLKKVLEKAWA